MVGLGQNDKNAVGSSNNPPSADKGLLGKRRMDENGGDAPNSTDNMNNNKKQYKITDAPSSSLAFQPA